MIGNRNGFVVKGGKIKVQCPGCKKVRYYAVPPNLRRKIARCDCGRTVCCTLDYRKKCRESSVAKAEVVLDTRVFRAQISDVSLVGLGFTLKGLTKPFRIGQDVTIQFKSVGGKNSMRKIRIMNVTPSRVGARYTDIWLA